MELAYTLITFGAVLGIPATIIQYVRKQRHMPFSEGFSMLAFAGLTTIVAGVVILAMIGVFVTVAPHMEGNDMLVAYSMIVIGCMIILATLVFEVWMFRWNVRLALRVFWQEANITCPRNRIQLTRRQQDLHAYIYTAIVTGFVLALTGIWSFRVIDG